VEDFREMFFLFFYFVSVVEFIRRSNERAECGRGFLLFNNRIDVVAPKLLLLSFPLYLNGK
jgi:hypothetical protein